jgi:hypothetical protein
MSFLAGVAAGALLNQALVARRQGPPADTRGMQRGTRPGIPGGLTTDSEESYPIRSLPRTDEQVRQRIVSQLGRTISNPEAVQVEVNGGRVVLRGRVQARDSILLMAEVENTAGVTSVQNLVQFEGSMADVAPGMTHDRPSVRAGELASSRMS